MVTSLIIQKSLLLWLTKPNNMENSWLDFCVPWITFVNCKEWHHFTKWEPYKILAVLSRTSNSQVHLSDILFSLLMSHMCKPVKFTIVTLTAVVYGFFAHNTQASGQND